MFFNAIVLSVISSPRVFWNTALSTVVQAGRFVSALIVNPMYVAGGIKLTVYVIAGLQATGLAAACMLWHRTKSEKQGVHTA